MAEFALRPLSLGELLDRSFTIFRRRFGAIILIMIACLLIPSLMFLNNIRGFMVMAQQMQPGGSPQEQMQVMFAMFGTIFKIAAVFALGMLIARTALGWIAHKAMLGEDTDVMTALTHGVKLFFPMLGLLLVEMAIIIVAEIVLYIPMIIFGVGAVGTAAATKSAPGLGFGLGMLVMMIGYLIAILYVFASLFVTTSTLVAEADTGVFKAVERSWNLTKGRRGAIIGSMILVYVLVWVVMLAVSFTVGIGAGLAGAGAGAAGGMMLAVFGGMILFSLAVSGFYFVLQMVTYYDLRVRKEGLDLELASAAMTQA
ncbi:MAG TPA: hypothetical protein VG940_01795 [Gemmatimonadales bacterium]|nr:hypothetical protein [Gemmatimonadales bacterium]